MNFKELLSKKKPDLDQIMKNGTAPTLEQVAGYEFRGYNFNKLTVFSDTLKFKKGFYGYPTEETLWGYNVPVVQNAVDEPWIAKSDESGPIKYYPFKVFPASHNQGGKHPNGLIVDYKASNQYSFINPVQQTIDWIVFVEPGNPDLLLGISYFRFFGALSFMGYFALERYNKGDNAVAQFFEEHELRTLRSFAEVYFPQQGSKVTPQQVANNIDNQVAHVSSNRTQSLKLILNALEIVLPGLLGAKKSFSRLNPTERREFLDKAFRSEMKEPLRGIMRDLARLRVLIISGYYSDVAAQASIGFVPVNKRTRFTANDLRVEAAPPITLFTPTTQSIEADICIIGSGAGGAVVAANAAKAGQKVVLIEEGPHIPATSMSNNEGEMVARLYKEGGLQTSVDFDMTILQGKCLGGTTVINNLICFRLLDDPDLGGEHGTALLDRWQNDPSIRISLDRNKLKEAYNRVSARLTPKRIEQKIAKENADVLITGYDRLKAKDNSVSARAKNYFMTNLGDCIGCGFCNYGCKFGRKLSMLETYVPDAIAAGARVITNCHATKIVHNNGNATQVECTIGQEKKLTINAKKIVISCGAIGSSKLLMKSNIGNGNLGKRFSFNAATPMFAEFDKAVNGYDCVQMGSYVDFKDFMLESIFYPPMSFAMTMPGWFEQHFERVRKLANFACAGVLIGTDHESSVKKWSLIPDLTGPVDLKLTANDLENLRKGMIMLARLYFEAGATSVYPVTYKDKPITRADYDGGRVESIIREHVKKTDDLLLSSSHPQGGNAMSSSAANGVIDNQFRVHGFQNLFVCDASVFPTTIRINPQFTIMAFAEYAWEQSISK